MLLMMCFDIGKGQLAIISWAVKITVEGSDSTYIKIDIQYDDGNFEHFIDVMIGFCDVEMGLRR